jgi:hypothetical protein
MWQLGVLWERARRLANKVPELPEAAWKAIGRLVRLIDTIVRAMLPDKWVRAPNGEARTWVLVATWTVTTVVILGVAMGLASATGLLGDLTGGGESAAPAAVVAPTAATTPTTAPLPAATPPAANAPAAPPPVPAIITVRGTFDESVYTSSGLNVVENSIVLDLPRDGGPVTGSALVRLDNVPIGAILEQIYGGLGGSPADYPELQGCMSAVTVEANDIAGSYSPQDSKITGSATWAGKVEDRPCLSPLPPGLTSDEAVQTTTLTLDATFDGREVVGAFSNPSGEEQKFQATVQ